MAQISNQKGFSIVEMLIVLAVVVVLSAMAVMTLSNPKKYVADDQAKNLIDILDEARQKSLNQRKTFRVEVNKTKKEVRLIDEGTDTTTASDDTILKRYQISEQVVIGSAPSNVTGAPTATSPIPVQTYSSSTYPLSSGDQKITLRFTRTGRVVDAGTDNIGTGSIMSGATIYVHSITPSATTPDVIRAVTVLGTTGDTSLFKCKFVSGSCTNWSK